MNIEKWKDVAELTALVAVVGSLIAVAIELRQTQASLQAQTYQDRAFEAIQWHLEIAKDPQLAQLAIETDAFISEELSPKDLSPTKYERSRAILLALMIDADNEHYQYQRGFLDEDFYHGDTVSTIAQFAPIWRKFEIEESRRDFRVEVDRILAEPPEQ